MVINVGPKPRQVMLKNKNTLFEFWAFLEYLLVCHPSLRVMAYFVRVDVEGKRDPARTRNRTGATMLRNRSVPRCDVILELAYPDVGEPLLAFRSFRFNVRIRIGSHRTQLNEGEGEGAIVGRAVVLAAPDTYIL